MDHEQDYGDQCDQEREVSREVCTAEEQVMSEKNKKILQEIERKFEEINKFLNSQMVSFQRTTFNCSTSEDFPLFTRTMIKQYLLR